MNEIQIVVGLIVGVFTTIFIVNDVKKRGMSQGWAVLGFFLGLIGLVIYLIARKPVLTIQNTNQQFVQKTPTINSQPNIPSLIIPEICPHCKNPNTKKIRLCEWCGNQII